MEPLLRTIRHFYFTIVLTLAPSPPINTNDSYRLFFFHLIVYGLKGLFPWWSRLVGWNYADDNLMLRIHAASWEKSILPKHSNRKVGSAETFFSENFSEKLSIQWPFFYVTRKSRKKIDCEFLEIVPFSIRASKREEFEWNFSSVSLAIVRTSRNFSGDVVWGWVGRSVAKCLNDYFCLEATSFVGEPEISEKSWRVRRWVFRAHGAITVMTIENKQRTNSIERLISFMCAKRTLVVMIYGSDRKRAVIATSIYMRGRTRCGRENKNWSERVRSLVQASKREEGREVAL